MIRKRERIKKGQKKRLITKW